MTPPFDSKDFYGFLRTAGWRDSSIRCLEQQFESHIMAFLRRNYGDLQYHDMLDICQNTLVQVFLCASECKSAKAVSAGDSENGMWAWVRQIARRLQSAHLKKQIRTSRIMKEIFRIAGDKSKSAASIDFLEIADSYRRIREKLFETSNCSADTLDVGWDALCGVDVAEIIKKYPGFTEPRVYQAKFRVQQELRKLLKKWDPM